MRAVKQDDLPDQNRLLSRLNRKFEFSEAVPRDRFKEESAVTQLFLASRSAPQWVGTGDGIELPRRQDQDFDVMPEVLGDPGSQGRGKFARVRPTGAKDHVPAL